MHRIIERECVMRSSLARVVFLMTVISAILAATSASASETDQFYGREITIRDSAAVINARVNGAIAKSIEEWEGPRDDFAFARKVRRNVDGWFAFNRISFWADSHPDIDRVDTLMSDSVYEGLPPTLSFLPIMRHLSATIAVEIGDAGSTEWPRRMVRFGADKLTHMLSVGWTYVPKYYAKGEAEALSAGWATEAGVLGYTSNGVFSNGDLVANYEGYLFYRGLSEDGMVRGKKAIVRWEGDRPVLQRDFTIADHASEYWDEAINTDHYKPGIARHVKRRLQRYCEQYRARPELYEIDPSIEAQLDAKYERLMLRRNKALRVGKVCAAE